MFTHSVPDVYSARHARGKRRCFQVNPAYDNLCDRAGPVCVVRNMPFPHRLIVSYVSCRFYLAE